MGLLSLSFYVFRSSSLLTALAMRPLREALGVVAVDRLLVLRRPILTDLVLLEDGVALGLQFLLSWRTRHRLHDEDRQAVRLLAILGSHDRPRILEVLEVMRTFHELRERSHTWSPFEGSKIFLVLHQLLCCLSTEHSIGPCRYVRYVLCIINRFFMVNY